MGDQETDKNGEHKVSLLKFYNFLFYYTEFQDN